MDDDDPQLHSPPAKTQKWQTNLSGKRYQINLGCSDHAKRLWDQFDMYEKRLGYETMADAAKWILEQIGPLVKDQEPKPTKMAEKRNYPKSESLRCSSKIGHTLQTTKQEQHFKLM